MHVEIQAFEGESESSQGNSDEDKRGANTAPSATTSSGPNSIASRNASSTGAKIKRIGRRRRRGRGTMTRGRRMSNLPLH